MLGNNGLGLETCRQLAKHNPHIYLAARTPSKAESAIADIKGTAPNANITFLELDLASLESVKKAADTFNAKSDRLDVLINNAGVMALPASTTKEGYEIQFGTNHIGHFLFTKLLMPTLQRTAEGNSDVRIVNLSSEGHRLPPKGGLALKDAHSNMASYNTCSPDNSRSAIPPSRALLFTQEALTLDFHWVSGKNIRGWQ